MHFFLNFSHILEDSNFVASIPADEDSTDDRRLKKKFYNGIDERV